jgi:hypothetical protein
VWNLGEDRVTSGDEPSQKGDVEGLVPEEFVSGSGWRFARTMPECPHEYTVRDLEGGGAKTTAMGEAEFEWFVRLIREKGELDEWGGQIKPYLRVGDWRYWTMGYPVGETTIINREPVTEEAWAELRGRIADQLVPSHPQKA